jgi:uncharacterized membrane protein YfcA
VSDKETLSTRVTNSRKQDVQRWGERRGYDSLSQATGELVAVGLRESEQPLLYRAKDLSIEAAWYLAIGGVIAILLGFTTSGLTPADGVRVAAVFVSVGASLIASIEFLRYLSGSSSINEDSITTKLANLKQ